MRFHCVFATLCTAFAPFAPAICRWAGRTSAGPIPPPLFTTGNVVKQTAQRMCTPQSLPKTPLWCERGIWGLQGMHCRKDKGIEEILIMQMTFLEAYCGSEMENTYRRVCRALLALPETASPSYLLPRKHRLLWHKGKRSALFRAHGLELLFPRSM